MAEIRTSSGDRRVRGFRMDSAGGNKSDSHRPVSGRNGNRDGMGRDGRGSKGIPQPPGSTTPTDEATEAWQATRHRLGDIMFPGGMLWVSQLTCLGESDRRLVLAGQAEVVAWCRRRYGSVIGDATRQASSFEGCLICEGSA